MNKRILLAGALAGIAVSACGSTTTTVIEKPGPTVTATRTVPGPTRTITKTAHTGYAHPYQDPIWNCWAAYMHNGNSSAGLSTYCQNVTPNGTGQGPSPTSTQITVNCLQQQCTTLPGAGPGGTTCSPPVNNVQVCH